MQTLAPRYHPSQFLRLLYLGLLCCIFPIGIFASLALSQVFTLGLPRYDFILILCLGLQVYMVASKLESPRELLVICTFHILGLALELYKTGAGSWTYPEFAFSKVGGVGSSVPLYSGFMYASVASFICQAWRRFDLKVRGWPRGEIITLLGLGIYLNFFTHHFWMDFRWFLMGAVGVLLWRSSVKLRVGTQDYRVPLTLTFVVMGLCIWGAENITTFFGAWQYPDQQAGWRPVGTSKISSWFLLFIVSFMVVAGLKKLEGRTLEGRGKSTLEEF